MRRACKTLQGCTLKSATGYRLLHAGPVLGSHLRKDDAMLDSLRKASSGWIAKGLMGLLVVSFAVWGVNDVFRGFSTTAVATVGGEPIPVDRYQVAVDQKIREFSQRVGQPVTRADAHKYGLDVSTLSELIGLKAFDIGAKKTGLAVGDDVVGANITQDPSFASTFGKFDRQTFDMTLQRMGVSERSFIEDRRNYLVRLQLNSALESANDVPVSLIDAITRFQGETRTAKYIILPPAAVGDIATPDEKVLTAYYDKAAIHFTIPETRDFTVAELNLEDLIANAVISDEALKAAYDARRAEFDVPEHRVIAQIPFPTEAAAKAADERLKSGVPVTTIVSELGLEIADVALGNISRGEMLSPETANAAFALPVGQFSDPVKGPLGYVILHVSSITPAVPSTFESAKSKLRGLMASEQAQNEVYDIQNAIEDARAGGASLEEIAAKNHLTLTKFTGVSAVGLDIKGKKPVGLPDYKDLMKQVYTNEVGDQIPPGDTGRGGYFWVNVDNVSPAKQKPFAEVRADVEKLWKDETRKAKLAELAQNLAERGNKGETIEKIASSINRSALTSPEIKRTSENETFSRLAVTRLFAQPKGGFVAGPVGFGDSMIVMEVTDIAEPEPDTKSKDYTDLKATLSDALSTDQLMTVITGYEQTLGTVVNTQLLSKLAADAGQ